MPLESPLARLVVGANDFADAQRSGTRGAANEARHRNPRRVGPDRRARRVCVYCAQTFHGA
eukprot:2062215-Lingulodinium_polyedra.AAC.1